MTNKQSILDKVKAKARIATSGISKIIYIDSDVRSFVCQSSSHLGAPDENGKQQKTKVLLNFGNGKMKEVTCEICGTVYKRM